MALAPALWPSLALVPAVGGCARNPDALERDVRHLDEEVRELRQERTRLHQRITELQNRVLLLEDRLESARLALQSRDRRPNLPVVALAPEGEGTFSRIYPSPAGGSTGAGASQAEASRGTTYPPPPLPAEGRPGGFPASVDRRGIEVDERLPVVPLPDALPPARAAGPSMPPAEDALSASRAGPPAPADPPAVPPPLPADPDSAYKLAYDTLKAGRTEEALDLFLRFVGKWGQHDYADNALYWVGECHYTRKRFEAALGYFLRVVEEYPRGNKVPDALLKAGLCYANLGRREVAAELLGQVMEIYPESEAARVARERLASLGQ